MFKFLFRNNTKYIKKDILKYLLKSNDKEFKLIELKNKFKYSDVFDFVSVLIDLTKENKIQMFVRVILEDGTVIGEYKNIMDVPDIINNNIITPDDLCIMYRKVV